MVDYFFVATIPFLGKMLACVHVRESDIERLINGATFRNNQPNALTNVLPLMLTEPIIEAAAFRF